MIDNDKMQHFSNRKKKWVDRHILENEECLKHVLDIFERNNYSITDDNTSDVWYEIAYYKGNKALFIHCTKKQYDYIICINVNYKTQFVYLQVLQMNYNRTVREIIRNGFIISNKFYMSDFCWVDAIRDICVWEGITSKECINDNDK